MTKLKEVYKCEICGNIVEVLDTGMGQLVCCNKPMSRLDENTTDAANEKHVPVIKETENGYEVSVGEVLHPMEESHYIKWIELIVDDVSYIKHLKPEDKPIVNFCVKKGLTVIAREYCNLHGFWKKEL